LKATIVYNRRVIEVCSRLSFSRVGLFSIAKDYSMLRWALIFLIVALIAGVLGFGVVEGTAAWIAKVLFVVFIILFIIGLVTGRRPGV